MDKIKVFDGCFNPIKYIKNDDIFIVLTPEEKNMLMVTREKFNEVVPDTANENNKLTDKEYVDGIKTELTTAINNEITRAENAEQLLDTDIAIINSKIPSTARDTNKLTDKLYVDELVLSEQTRAENAESLLADDISAEQARAEDVEDLLDRRIDHEIERASTKEALLDSAISAELTRAESVELQLQNTTEKISNKTDVLNNQNPSSIKYSSEKGVVTYVTNELSQPKSDIATINSKIPSTASDANKLTDKLYVDGKVSAEQSRAESAEDLLDRSIDHEVERATTKEMLLENDIAIINSKIPSTARDTNKLADIGFVNSSISTSTATFRGTFNVVTDLDLEPSATLSDIEAALAKKILQRDNNDYSFVQIPTDSTAVNIKRVDRYKFNGTNWEFEYSLNNSGFTAEQWAAINSTITTAAVNKLNDLPNKLDLDALLAAKVNKNGDDLNGDLNLNGYGLYVRRAPSGLRRGIKFEDYLDYSKQGIYVGNANMRLFLETDQKDYYDNPIDIIHKKGSNYYTMLDEGNTKTINNLSLLGSGNISVYTKDEVDSIIDDVNDSIDIIDEVTAEGLYNLNERKQDIIEDLETIRSGAALGETAYQKPQSGIPASDIASGVIPDISNLANKAGSLSQDFAAKSLSVLGRGTSNGIKLYRSDGQIPYGRIIMESDLVSRGIDYMLPTTGVAEQSAVVLATKASVDAKYTKPSSGIPASDIANGVIPDVSQFITKSVNDLVNYYTKSLTYTQSEVDALIGNIQHFHYEIFASLQDITSPATNVLYLIGPTGSGSDKYEEYVYANNKFTKIGDTSIDLSNYVTTQSLTSALQQFAQDLQTELNNYALKSQIKTVNGNSLIGSGDVSIHPEIVNLTDGEHNSGYYEDLMRATGHLKLDTPQIFIYTAYNNNHIATTAMCFSTCTNTESPTTNAVIKQTLFLGTFKSVRTLSNTVSGDLYQVVDTWAQILDVKQSDLDSKVSRAGSSMTGDLDLDGHALLVRKSGDEVRYGIRFAGEGVREGIYVGNPHMRLFLEADPNLDLIHKKGGDFYDILDTNNVATKGNIYQTTWGDTLDNIINAANAGKIVILKRDITYNEQKYSPTYVLNCFVKRVSDDYITECRFYARLEDNVVAEIACKRGPTWVDNGVMQLQENLVSGTNIKTINGESVLGGGNLSISGVSREDLENGNIVPLYSKTLEDWADQKAIATPDTYTDAVRTTGGDIPVETSAGSKPESIKPVVGSKWTAKLLFNGSYNMLNAAKWGSANSQPYVGGVGNDFVYFLVPELTLGTFGTADENNGLLFTDSEGENVEPTSVYFKPLGATVPQSLTDGTSVSPTSVSYDGSTYKDYATDGAGWLIIPKTYYDNDICAHIAWEDWYDKYVSLDEPTTNPEAVVGVLMLEGLLALAHSDKYLRGVNNEVCDNVVFGDTSATITHMVDELSVAANAWTNAATGESDSQGNALYRHSATVSLIKQGGAACVEGEDGGIPLTVNGTTVSYIDTNVAAPASVVFYEVTATSTTKAYTDSVFSGSNINTETGILPINDCSIEAQVAMDGKADITVKYAKNIVDQVAINATVDVPQIKREVENHEKRITELEDTAVRTGSYDASVSVGLADNFRGDSVVNAEFYKRKTGGTQSVGSGIAAIKEMRGKSIVWNQLVTNGDFSNGKTSWFTESQTSSIENGVLTVQQGGAYRGITQNSIPLVDSHKILLRVSLKANYKPAACGTRLANSGGGHITISLSSFVADTWLNGATIGTVNGDVAFGVYFGQMYDDGYISLKNVSIIDLTLMFGTGNEPTTVAEFEKMFPLDYYDYNAGEVIPFAAQNLVTTGKNQYNPATGKANLLGGQTYQLLGTYTDATIDGVAVTLDGNNCFTTTKDCALDVTGGNDTDTFVGLYNGETNTYEPYEKHTLPLDPSQWRDKQGNLVFPYGGMHGVGTAYDYAKVDADGYVRKAVRCFGRVYLKNLSWRINPVSTYTPYGEFYAGITDIKPSINNVMSTFLARCNVYRTLQVISSFPAAAAQDKLCYMACNGGHNGKNIYITDSSYTSVTDFVAHFKDNDCLVYQLATPVEVELATPIYVKYLVDKNGTEEITPTNGTTPYTTMANISVLYAMDARGEIKNLPKNYLSKESAENMLNAMVSAGVIASYTMTYDAANGRYAFTIVAPAQSNE